mmetsp:Transcript_43499/g.86443  ORF Transcript_43499/g.86443 Transcript_43499/m.86443 type:complete len:196 (-) Transcript_43499:105-692(-)
MSEHMLAAPVDKRGVGRRLSWVDEAPPLSARPVAEEIQIPREDADPCSPQDAADRQGETIVHLGILRQGNVYGVYTQLPAGTTAAEVEPPLPQGLTAQVVNGDSGDLRLWIECEAMEPGRSRNRFRVRLQGPELPHVTICVEASVMTPRDGRPSRIHDDIHVIRSISSEAVAFESEGSQWKRAAQAVDDVDECSP